MIDGGLKRLIRQTFNRCIGKDARTFVIGKYTFEVVSIRPAVMSHSEVTSGTKVVRVRIKYSRKKSWTPSDLATLELKMEECQISWHAGGGNLSDMPREVHRFVRAALTKLLEHTQANPHHLKFGLTPTTMNSMKLFSKAMGGKS